jgi:hypothetical protein
MVCECAQGVLVINIIESNGKHLFAADGLFLETYQSSDSSPAIKDVQFALLADDLKIYGYRGQFTAIAQFYELVIPGLILAKHIFRGLERPLCCDDNMEADERKLIYTRKPQFDFEWIGGPHGSPVRRSVPPGKVFVVIISPNEKHIETFPEIAGWIERWNWVDEDSGLSEAPTNWVDRYREKLWTRG